MLPPPNEKLALICKSAVTAADRSAAASQTNESAKIPAARVKIAAAIAVMDESCQVAWGGCNAEEWMYPASVVKLFHLIYTLNLADGCGTQLSQEHRRALGDMIRVSSNDADSYVVDAYSGVTGGPELDAQMFEDWLAHRLEIDQFFADAGLAEVIVCQKTWNETPYGRELQSRGPNGERRNRLNAKSTLGLLVGVFSGNAFISPESHRFALELMKREIPATTEEDNGQAKDYSGKLMPNGTKLWSKAGWTDEVRHDAAWVQLPNGQSAGWAILTEGLSDQADIIPSIASSLADALAE